MPVFQRGGSTVPKRERIRRSSALMHNDPITLVVAPDRQGMAKGTLYLDDGKSFDYKQGSKLYMEITYDNGRLESKMIEAGANLVQRVHLIMHLLKAWRLLSGWRKS